MASRISGPPSPIARPTDFGIPTRVGGGTPSIDFNGTRYTSIEGPAADNRLSIDPFRRFNPLLERGVALTSVQARRLGVRVGDEVTVRDLLTDETWTATFYDSAGSKPDGLQHFEVSPALADMLGLKYRTSSGRVIDAVLNANTMRGRFVIEK